MSIKSGLYATFTIVVHASVWIFVLAYFFGFTTKNGLLGFLQRDATVGDVLVIGFVLLFIIDDLCVARKKITNQMITDLSVIVMKIGKRSDEDPRQQ